MQKFCVHCGKEVENLENLNFCPFCGGNLKRQKEENIKVDKISRSSANSEIDPVTKISIKDSFYERNMLLLHKVLFWTVIFAPYMIILNDIYLNKFVHNNEFWIKRAKIYFIFLIVIYSLLRIFSTFEIENLPFANFLAMYSVLFPIYYLQLNYGHLFATAGKYTPTEEEVKNIIAIQNIDNDEENRKKKIKFRTIFGVFFVLAYIFIFNVMYQSHYLASILSLFLIAGYDYYEQKYFKRDKTELFWKKRVMFYVLVLSPILVVLNFIIYN
ncbi:zinc ribbon domain-containing protein [Arcobacter cloacae]|uniref:Uncharacterized protein n=1 Tax=Arcobacter cloacae TaxID=1054034 RepID=A0A6M8NPS1_9BACT|nr:zinc ribbon domain-containing protein [Arcobacter cloacae]QKF90477.1 putative membrane protein [Arcobacter cloacae]RXI38247.1 hypothetical protein CP963_11490 [Arcobacter cloacae]